ncbi:MAG: hypothetical protein CL568_08580 [Alphaproteobacteria bacterium]|nr:hypothetical protein [Alphaproteobacteria bacterium]
MFPIKNSKMRGILSMILGGAALTISDAATKYLTSSLPIGEILFIRALLVLIIIWLITWMRGRLEDLRIRTIGGQGLRSFLAVCSTILIVTSLSLLPLNEVIAILFVGPLFIAILAGPLLGERVGVRRWVAILIGFGGMLIIVRPGSAAFQLAALIPVAAALVASFRDIVTREISAKESSAAILFYSTLALTVFGLATLPFGWALLDGEEILVALLAGVMFGIGHYFIIEGFSYAEASIVAPYRYLNIVWAAILGFAIWQEIPSSWTFLGAPLIVVSGLYILVGEKMSPVKMVDSKNDL